jgi:P-type Cu2+ transporter
LIADLYRSLQTAAPPVLPGIDDGPAEQAVSPEPSDVCRTTAYAPCAHCGEPTRIASLEQEAENGEEKVFCCAGCSAAYSLIHGWGLSDFYALRERTGSNGVARPAGQLQRFEQFDSPDFLGASAPKHHDDGYCSTELAVHGLHCGACAWLIENATLHEEGIVSARVKMSEHTLRLVFDPARTSLSAIAGLLDRLGYQLAPFDAGRRNHIRVENRRRLVQIAAAGFLAANAMWIAVALYAGEYSGVAAEHRYFLGLIGTGLGLLSVLLPGRTFFTGALAALKTRTPHMDLPVALGLSAGAIVGSWNALRGSGHVYFDSLATLVFLLLIGRWIQFRQQYRAAQAVDLMLRITPQHATLTTADGPRTVLADSLIPGDVIHVSAGDSIAADGQIVEGRSDVDRSLLTGESMPMRAEVGTQVFAGMINLTVPVQIRVSAVGRDSRMGRVMQSVEAATAEKTPIIMLADRVGGYFVVAVTALALVTFAYWLPSSGLSSATSNATALLIVACPCALALATPLAIAVGLGRAARASILIRDGAAMQHLAKPGHAWFDKTGTLTEGRQRVTRLVGSEESLRLAASVESHCAHPIAQAICRDALQRGLELDPHGRLHRAVQGGVLGTAAGQEIAVGNSNLMQSQDITIAEPFASTAGKCVERGESPIFIAAGGQIIALIGLADPLRAEAQHVVNRLVSAGWTVGILSGDHPEVVRRVGRLLNLPPDKCHGGLSPEQKLSTVRQSHTADSKVVMIGDGANDAAALAAADVGVAVRGGAEVSLQAAPIFVASGELPSLIRLFEGSRRTTQIIYLTFGVSLTYNVIAVALAMLGWINPLIAAVLMPISSVSVIAVTLLCKSFEEPLP